MVGKVVVGDQRRVLVSTLKCGYEVKGGKEVRVAQHLRCSALKFLGGKERLVPLGTEGARTFLI